MLLAMSSKNILDQTPFDVIEQTILTANIAYTLLKKRCSDRKSYPNYAIPVKH